MGQADFPLRGFKARRHYPTTTCPPHALGPWGLLGRQDHRRPPRRGLGDPAPHQPPAAPVRRVWRCPRQPAPVIPARACRSVSRTPSGPARRGPRGPEGVDRLWRRTPPDRGLTRDGQPRGLRLALPPPPQAPVSAVHAVAGAPGRQPAACAGPDLPRVGQRRRGGEAPLVRAARLWAAGPLGRPRGRRRALASPQGVAVATGIAQPPPSWPCSIRPAAPRYWRAPPAEGRPLLSKPVSSRTRTASESPRGWITARPRASRTASGSQSARRRRCGTASGVVSPRPSAHGQLFFRAAGLRSPRREAIARCRGSARSTAGARRRSRSFRYATPPWTTSTSWSASPGGVSFVSRLRPPALKGLGIMMPSK